MKRIVSITALLLFPICAFAACPDVTNSAGYVRAGATGSATGADWTNAFTSLPASLVRGCTYYVAVGTYGPHNFNDADSGTTAITIQAPTIASHGTATGWSNAFVGQAVWQCSASCGTIWNFTADYYVFNGEYRQKSSPESPYGDWSAGSSYGFEVSDANGNVGQNNMIQGGIGFAGSPCGSSAACDAAGIFQHDIAFHYVFLQGFNTTVDAHMEQGPTFQGGSYNLTFDHMGIVGVGIPFYLRGNHACISGCSNGGTYFFGTGDSITIESSFVSRNYVDEATNLHSEFCSCSEGLTNFVIAKNWIQDIVGTAVYAQAGSDTSNNGPVLVYGNVWTQDNNTHCQVGGGLWGAQGEVYNQPVYFLNNTIALNGYLDCPNQDEDGWGYGTQATTYQNVVFENNIWYDADLSVSNGMSLLNSGSGTIGGSTFTSLTWDYQSFFSSANSAAKDTSAHKQTSASNPFVDVATLNLNLTSDTTAGINTHSVVPGNDTDMLGNTRGANGTWDRGALQIAGSSDPPAASPAWLLALLKEVMP